MITERGPRERRREPLAEFLLATTPFPDLAFGRQLRRTSLDLVLRPAEVSWARLWRRNPGPPRWRRRAVSAWISGEENASPGGPEGGRQPLLFAVSAVWNEDDIIFAMVRNLFSQGADRVFIIDDDSDDDTAKEAEAAGAVVLRHQSNGIYNEKTRAVSLRELIAAQTAAAGRDIWWIVVDADEFPRGAGGSTIREMISGLPSWVDVVGSRVLDHVPDSTSSYARRDHPVSAFPLARWYVNHYCPDGHWKHQLLHIRHPGDLVPLPGCHVVSAGGQRRVREPSASLLMHHFPLRGHERTAEKFALAAAPGGRYARSPDAFSRSRLLQRMSHLDLYYRDAARLVPCTWPGQPRRPGELWPWQELVPEPERSWLARDSA